MNILNNHSKNQMPTLITTCAGKDINTWKVAASKIVKYIRCDEYILVVPTQDYSQFKRCTPSRFEIISESEFCPGLKDKIKKAIPLQHRDRVGWYLQQIIKLKLLETYQNKDYIVIWDADTVPTKTLNFTDSDKINVYIGEEYNEEYFLSNEYLTGIGKIAPFSFIAQCLACKGLWAKEFFIHIEKKHEENWENIILKLLTISHDSSFSEYEALGSFIYKNHRDELNLLLNNKWLRHGRGYYGNASLFKMLVPMVRMSHDFVSFESWDKPFSRYKTKLREVMKRNEIK